jgi:hypothetical protein
MPSGDRTLASSRESCEFSCITFKIHGYMIRYAKQHMRTIAMLWSSAQNVVKHGATM